MASSNQKASTSITFESIWKYDAFLSFRGEDTRKTFTDHLYNALLKKKINVFRDNELERGTTIGLEFSTTIAHSRFAIIVLSQDYASSKSCLVELVQIFKCMEERGTIIPIFYNVDPSDVKDQTGTFEEAFNKHEKDGIPAENVEAWKKALTTVGNRAGWNWALYQSESKFIEEIVDYLYKKLACAGCNQTVHDGLNCTGTLWHRACLVCKGCNKQFQELEVWNCKNHPYHKRCYELLWTVCNVCKKPVRDNVEGQVEYRDHPFWRQRYCPSHAKDGTPTCCSCERLHPSDTVYYKLDDGRKLCRECKESIINTGKGRRSICLEVRNFFLKELNVRIENIPVRLVSRQEIIDVMKERSDGFGRPLPVIRTVCLYGERTITCSAIMGRPSQLCCQVKEILILYGLPRILTGSLLAQQTMRAWLRLNRCPNLSPEVQNGICRYIAYRWLESVNKLSAFEKKLCEFRKRKIESDCSEALTRARNAVSKHGLRKTLQTIRKTGSFPSMIHQNT